MHSKLFYDTTKLQSAIEQHILRSRNADHYRTSHKWRKIKSEIREIFEMWNSQTVQNGTVQHVSELT